MALLVVYIGVHEQGNLQILHPRLESYFPAQSTTPLRGLR